jgi:hypothetical protein
MKKYIVKEVMLHFYVVRTQDNVSMCFCNNESFADQIAFALNAAEDL